MAPSPKYSDIPGDGGSDILSQVGEQQRQIRNSLLGIRHRLAIASGKGGVGKSTLSRHIASALACHGRSVAVLDADLNGPTQARLGGVDSTPPLPGAQGLVLPRTADGVGVLSLGSFLPESVAIDFDNVALGQSHTWRAIREFTALSEILTGVDWGSLDVLILDLPPGAERTLQFAEFLGPEVAFLLVTVPSAVASGVVARSIAALGPTGTDVLGHVLNMDGYACAGCRRVQPLFPVGQVDALTTEQLGSVPFDPELAALCDRGGSFQEVRNSDVGRAIDALAKRVMDRLERR